VDWLQAHDLSCNSAGSHESLLKGRISNVSLENVDRKLRQAVSSIPAADRKFLLEILTSDDAMRADTIGDLHAAGRTPATVELLIDAESDRQVRALLVGLLLQAR
jgi:hypothetical protein